MLQGIRDRAQSWIMWVIVGLLIIPFALWGIHQYFSPDVNVTVANVDGHELSLREFQDNYQRQRERIRQLLGGRTGMNDLDERRLREETLKRMVDEEVVVQAALEQGMRISDEQLARAIRTAEVFQDADGFSNARYDAFLRNMGHSPGSFEYVLRRDLLRAQVQLGVVGSALATEPVVRSALRLSGQRRSFAVLTLSADQFLDQRPVDDGAVKAYYEEHRDQFTVPEQVRIAYVEISPELLAARVEVSEEQVRARFEASKANYVTPEQRRASHILLQLPEDAPEAQVAEVTARVEGLMAQLDGGASFADLAKAHSQDPGSAGEGGDLGFFDQGTMVAPFDEAVFAMDEGEVRGPVRSSFGVHIIQLTGIRRGGQQGLDEVRAQVAEELRRQAGEKLFFDQAEQFANLVFENPDTLEVAAEALGLPILEAGPFSRDGGPGLAGEPKVLAAAFAEDVLEGNNSEPLELDDHRLIALRVRERIPERVRPLEEVADDIAGRLRGEAAAAAARERGEALVSRLTAGGGEAMAGVAAESGGEWRRYERVGRGERGVPRPILQEVFRMPHPPAEGERFGGTALADGSYAVVALTAVEPGPVDPAGQAELQALLTRDQGDELYAALVQAFRTMADVEVFPGRL